MQRMFGRKSDRPRAVCQVASVDTNSRPNDALADSDGLGELIRRLLPTPAVAPQRASPIPSDYELLVQRLLGTVQPVQPVIQERSSITDMEVLLQSMLPVAPLAEETVGPRTDRRIVVLLPRPRRGLRGIVFTRSVCLSVCLCVCVCVCVCLSVCLCICVSGQYFGILFLGY